MLGQGWDANGWDGPARPLDPRRGSGGAGLPRLPRRARGLGQQRGAPGRGDRSATPPIRSGGGSCATPRGADRAAARAGGRAGSPAAAGAAGRSCWTEALREAQAEAHRLGVTGIHNVEDEPVLAAFRRLEPRDALRLRVLFHPPVASLGRLVADGVRSGHGLRVAHDRRSEDVPRRQPRQPDRLDAGALRGQPGSRHADLTDRSEAARRDAARGRGRDRLRRCTPSAMRPCGARSIS